MALVNLSILVGGGLNGCKEMQFKEKLTLLSVGSGLHMVKVLGFQTIPLNPSIIPAIFLGVPFLVGSTFCIGTVLGKAGKRAFES
jgi:hypothetical protein